MPLKLLTLEIVKLNGETVSFKNPSRIMLANAFRRLQLGTLQHVALQIKHQDTTMLEEANKGGYDYGKAHNHFRKLRAAELRRRK